MTRKRKSNGARTYAAYLFRDKDPVIYQIQQFVGDTKLAHVTKSGGPSTTCMRMWFDPEGTKRPQNATIEAAGRALGWERTWKRIIRRGE